MFNRNDRGGSRGGFGGGNRGGFEKKQMHKATCSDCGNSCEVPFRPTGERPIYCSNCFGRHREDAPQRQNSGPRNFEKQNFDNRSHGDTFRKDMPVRQEYRPDTQTKDALEKINNKLERILKLLTPTIIVTPEEIEKVVVAEKIEKTNEKAKPAKTAKKKVAKK